MRQWLCDISKVNSAWSYNFTIIHKAIDPYMKKYSAGLRSCTVPVYNDSKQGLLLP